MAEIVNLLPYDLVLVSLDGLIWDDRVRIFYHPTNSARILDRVPASGNVARAEISFVPVADELGWPSAYRDFGPTEGLPEIVDGNIYVASSMTIESMTHNGIYSSQFRIPGRIVKTRNEDGSCGYVIGCVELAVY